MKKQLQTFACLVAFVTAFGNTGWAQGRTMVPIKVQIVISRYQGDKKVSSVPYTLSVNAGGNNRSSLRMGADVPTGTSTVTKDGATTTRVDYKQVGTNIDCTGSIVDETRFGLFINIEDSSVYPSGQGTALPNSGPPPSRVGGELSFRHFGASENVILKDGQSSEFTVATDKFTGEVIKAEVTLTVVK